MRRLTILLSLALAGALAAAACTGGSASTGDELPQGNWLDGADPTVVLSSELCREPSPGPSPLRRLTNAEYKNTLVDLGLDPAGVETAASVLPQEPESLGFRNGASALLVTTLLAQKYQAIAEQLTAAYAYPCPSPADEASCADKMIRHAGARTHRRALSDDEIASYRRIYEQARELDSHDEAVSWVMRAMLMSPHFLYKVEIPVAEQALPVTGFEMASRLSYALWQSSPDEELRILAAAGELETKEQILAQARRMLGDARALRSLDFFEQWLDLDRLVAIQRDPELYPNLSPKLAELLRAESRSFLGYLLQNPDATFEDLLSSNVTFANAELAEHYGLDAVPGDAFQKVEAPNRSGILTQGMLAVRDAATRTSIVRRGLKIRTDFLCELVPAPPDSVDLTLAGIGPDLTQAERLLEHRKSASCNACHRVMDPIGGVFESFDAVGRYRTVDEHGGPISTEGEIFNSMDADGALSGVAELAQRLSQSAEARQCYLIQNFRYFFGREAAREDLCSQAQLANYWSHSGLRLAEVLLGLTQTDAFLYKAKKQAEPDALAPSGQGGQP